MKERRRNSKNGQAFVVLLLISQKESASHDFE
jgi:hypothetical protein